MFSRISIAYILLIAIAAHAPAAAAGAQEPKKAESAPTGSGWAAVSTPEEINKAKGNYQLHCATCHGVKGDGKGDLADSLGEGIKPRDHTDAKTMGTRSDANLFKVISEGGESMGFDAAMPPFNTVLSKKEIEALVKYLRILCKCKNE